MKENDFFLEVFNPSFPVSIRKKNSFGLGEDL